MSRPNDYDSTEAYDRRHEPRYSLNDVDALLMLILNLNEQHVAAAFGHDLDRVRRDANAGSRGAQAQLAYLTEKHADLIRNGRIYGDLLWPALDFGNRQRFLEYAAKRRRDFDEEHGMSPADEQPSDARAEATTPHICATCEDHGDIFLPMDDYDSAVGGHKTQSQMGAHSHRFKAKSCPDCWKCEFCSGRLGAAGQESALPIGYAWAGTPANTPSGDAPRLCSVACLKQWCERSGLPRPMIASLLREYDNALRRQHLVDRDGVAWWADKHADVLDALDVLIRAGIQSRPLQDQGGSEAAR